MKFSYSLIVCCYNSEKVIQPTIKAICCLDSDVSDVIEVVIVDNNCEDRTVERVYDVWNSKTINLRVVTEAKPGLMNARKTGVDEASNEIIVFIDDDNILDAAWLRNLDKVFDKYENVACVGGKVMPAAGKPYPDWFYTFEAVYACGEQAPESMVVSKTRMTLFGAGLAFRLPVIQSIVADANLYLTGRTKNRLLRGDDSELCMRCLMMGYDTYYSNDLLLVHNLLPERVTWDYVKKARLGGGMAEIVLSIYRSINMGQEPRSYFGEMLFVVRRWLSFISRPENIFHVNKDGSLESFEFQYLKGLVNGLVYFSPKRYNVIRNELLRLNSYYKVNKTDT